MYYPVKELFSTNNYEVYSEVKGKRFKSRADVVCTKNEQVVVIELKTSLSFQLIDQARFWLRFADFVYVAVPKTKTERSQTALEILNALGIGLLEICLDSFEQEQQKPETQRDLSKFVTVVTKPKKNEIHIRDSKQFENLSEEHKTWAIGGQQSGTSRYVTNYALMMCDVYEYLRLELKNPETEGWVSSRMIWDYIKEHSRKSIVKHYKNPVANIGSAIRKYEQSDIEIMKIGNKFYFKIMEDSTKYLNMGEHNDG